MNNALNTLIKYTLFLMIINVLMLFSFNAQAGVVGEFGDILFKNAVINIWKGLGGISLFIAGAYLIANRRPFRFRIMALAASLLLFCMTGVGLLLFLGEFWPVIIKTISDAAAVISKIISAAAVIIHQLWR